jgi:hypothetical protein
MGCEVQVHEKTDKHGTWPYHCLDRSWYLYTSPEHYTEYTTVKSSKPRKNGSPTLFISNINPS